MEAEQKPAIERSNGYSNDHDLLIELRSDVRHLQSDVARIETDMKAGFAKVDTNIKGIRKGNTAILITLIGGLITIVAGFIINYFISR